MRSTRRLAVIGYGALGRELSRAVQALDEAETLIGFLIRPGRDAGPFRAVHDVASLADGAPDLVIECASQGAVAEFGPDILGRGLDFLLASTGAIADEALVARLRAASYQGGGGLFMAPGAVAGLDGLIAARLAGLAEVTYTSRKPPHAWRGAADTAIDLDHPEDERIIFEGSARAAALAFPRNANVAVSIGLAGLGLDRTTVRLVSSRLVDGPRGLIEATGKFGSFAFDILALATPENPKSSALTAYSLLQCARLGLGTPVFALLDPDGGSGLGGSRRPEPGG